MKVPPALHIFGYRPLHPGQATGLNEEQPKTSWYQNLTVGEISAGGG